MVNPLLRKGNCRWRSSLLLLTIVHFAVGTGATAQIDITEEIDLSIFSEESISPELAAWLDELRRNPIDLRTGSAEELAGIPGISPAAAERILFVVDSAGIDSVAGLRAVDGIDDDIVSILELFTVIGTTPESEEWDVEIRSRVAIDLQELRGFRDTLRRILVREDSVGIGTFDTIDLGPRYIAPPGAVTTRILLSSESLRFGLIVDRDPGERLLYIDSLDFTYTQYERVGPGNSVSQTRSGLGSFVSGFAQADLGDVALFLGDYSITSGSGLLFGRPFSGRKGGSATGDPFRPGGGIRPWTSRSESGYFRGVAAEVRLDTIGSFALRGSIFASRRFHDGSVRPVDSLRIDPTIDDEGLLATRTDLRRDDRIEERLGGIRITGSSDAGAVGATYYAADVRDRMTTESSFTRSRGASLDGGWRWRGGRISGEAALGISGWGITSSLGLDRRTFDGTLAFRHFSDDFESPRGVPFAESPTNPRGETGLYAGVRLRPVRRLTCEFYLDIYRRASRDPAWPYATDGSDLMSRLRWRPAGDWEVEGLIRFGQATDLPGSGRDDAGREIRVGTSERASVARVGLLWRDPERRLALRLRGEHRGEWRDTLRDGTLLTANIRWRVTERIRAGAGWTTFDAPSPGVLLYVAEQNLPGGMSLTTLSGRGGSYYLLALWSPLPSLDLGVRYAGITYSDRDVIRPGTLREIRGRTVSTLTVQLDWRP